MPHIEPNVLPGSAATDAKIRGTMEHLHQRILGHVEASEIERTFPLFASILTDAHERKGLEKEETYNCRQNLVAPVPDPDYTVRAWRGVVTYLLRQPDFLYE